MKRLLLIIGLALALSACQSPKVDLEPFPLFPEHRRSTAQVVRPPAAALKSASSAH